MHCITPTSIKAAHRTLALSGKFFAPVPYQLHKRGRRASLVFFFSSLCVLCYQCCNHHTNVFLQCQVFLFLTLSFSMMNKWVLQSSWVSVVGFHGWPSFRCMERLHYRIHFPVGGPCLSFSLPLSLWLIWVMLPWIFSFSSFHGHCSCFSLGQVSGKKLLHWWAGGCFLWKGCRLFPKVIIVFIQVPVSVLETVDPCQLQSPSFQMFACVGGPALAWFSFPMARSRAWLPILDNRALWSGRVWNPASPLGCF